MSARLTLHTPRSRCMHQEMFNMIEECTNRYRVADINETDEVEILIRIPKRFKSLWMIKLSDLQTNMQEIEDLKDEILG